jgi:hypothetical protein
LIAGASILTELGSSVTDFLSVDFSSIVGSAVGGDQSVTAVQARTIGLTVSISCTNTFSVASTVFTDTIIAPRLILVQTTVVGYAVSSSGNTSTARSALHAVLSGKAVSVIGTRSWVNANTSGNVANRIVSEIQVSAVGIVVANNATSVDLTVRSTGTGTVNETIGISGQLTIGIGRTSIATSSLRTDGFSIVSE